MSEVEIGLGPCGELRYPSYPEKRGWNYPGIGEFQCYDKYLKKNLSERAKARGLSLSEVMPENTGGYVSMPDETEFL
ncbi:uncharacterized protein A4U43_C04F12300 [Asparagus officinalis]|uniref:Beta-amylase n=1 Tax=Asparagus officinalis TaxID=4686 RepID=A0A5P1F4R2_ASPOF|nr:uncharacterized protein A4U43_C04F12300 [Asparagus officinalis]